MSGLVFISYSRQDDSFVRQLFLELEARHISCFYDQRRIRVGDKWTKEIEQSIDDCSCVLVVLSLQSLKSENVAQEINLAIECQKPIVPLKYQEVPVKNYHLAGRNYFSFVGKFDIVDTGIHIHEQAIDELILALINAGYSPENKSTPNLDPSSLGNDTLLKAEFLPDTSIVASPATVSLEKTNRSIEIEPFQTPTSIKQVLSSLAKNSIRALC